MKLLICLIAFAFAETAFALPAGRYERPQATGQPDILILEADRIVFWIETRQFGQHGDPSVPYPTVCRIMYGGRVISTEADSMTLEISMLHFVSAWKSNQIEACLNYVMTSAQAAKTRDVQVSMRLQGYTSSVSSQPPVRHEPSTSTSERAQEKLIETPRLPSALDINDIRDIEVQAGALLDQLQMSRYGLQALKDQLQTTNQMLNFEWSKVWKDGNRIHQLGQTKSQLEHSIRSNLELQMSIPKKMETACYEYWKYEAALSDPRLLPGIRSMCRYLKTIRESR